MINKWTVSLTRGARKQLNELPIVIQDLANEAIADLEQYGPFLDCWSVKKLGMHDYRIRLNYHYRMRYLIIPGRLLIQTFYIGHRKDAY